MMLLLMWSVTAVRVDGGWGGGGGSTFDSAPAELVHRVAARRSNPVVVEKVPNKAAADVVGQTGAASRARSDAGTTTLTRHRALQAQRAGRAADVSVDRTEESHKYKGLWLGLRGLKQE